MGLTQGAIVACLLAIGSAVGPAAARCGGGGATGSDGLPTGGLPSGLFKAVQPPRLLSDELRSACAADAQRLVYCSTYSSPYTLLTGEQRASCCASLQQFNINGCFCGWGAAADISIWLQSVLVDLATVTEECADTRVRCRREEEYFLEVGKRTSKSSMPVSVGEPHNAALFTAQAGGDEWRQRSNPFRRVDFTQRRSAGAGPRLYRPSAFPRTSQTAEELAQLQALGAIPLSQEQDVPKSEPSSFLLPILDLRRVKELLVSKAQPTGSQQAQETEDGEGVDGETEVDTQSNELDIEVEIEHEGTDSEELNSSLASAMRWLEMLGKPRDAHLGAEEQEKAIDPLDRSSALPLLLMRVLDVLRDALDSTDAQVDVALEIMVETTASKPAARGGGSASLRLAGTNHDSLHTGTGGSSQDEPALGLQDEGIMAHQEAMASDIGDVIEEGDERTHVHHVYRHTHCWMAAVARTAVAHPLLIGICAALAVCAGLALFCKEAEERVQAEAEAQERDASDKLVRYNVVVAPDDQYLAPDLTAPLLDTRGSLIHGLASKPYA